MTLSDILVEALRAVEEAKVPPELREIAFAKAIDLAAGTEQAAPRSAVRPQQEDSGRPGGSGALSGSVLQRIATKLRLEEAVVGHVYNVDGEGRLELVISQGRLPAAASAATKEIGLLMAAGRQASGVDAEWTATEEIRKVCEHFKRFDGPNFASTIKSMDDVFLMRGTPRKREVKMTVPAWEAATALVKRLAQIG